MIIKKPVEDIRPPSYAKREMRLNFVSKLNIEDSRITGRSRQRNFAMQIYIVLLFFISLSLMPFVPQFISHVYAQTTEIITKGNYQIKVFIENSDTIEAVVNNWLASQENIIVDQIKANNSTGNFTVVIRYHSGGSGTVPTRIKFFNTSTITSIPRDGSESDIWNQDSISIFSSEHNIQFVDMLTGNGPWDMFVVYDDGESLASKKNLLSESIESVLDDQSTSTSTESIPSSLDKDQITTALIEGALVSVTKDETTESVGNPSPQTAPASEVDAGIVETVIETVSKIINVDDSIQATPASQTSSAQDSGIVSEAITETLPLFENVNTNGTITTTTF